MALRSSRTIRHAPQGQRMKKKKNSTVLYLAKVPPDREGQLAVILAMFRKLTGREPTPEEIEDARKELEQ
jgi:hypothetical protein